MTIHHFGTDINAAQFVEVGDAHTVTAIDGAVLRLVSRPAAGTVLKVRSAPDLQGLPDITVDGSGYWTYTTQDIPLIQVSADGGSNWLPGELISREAATGSVLALDDVQAAVVQAQQAATTANTLGVRVTALEVGGTGGGGSSTVAGITDAGSAGKAVLLAADAAAARTAIGAGTSSLTIGTTAGTAKAGDVQPTIDQVTGVTTTGKALAKATDATAARTALSLDQVNNTSDANKPVSTATAAAIAKKQNIIPTFADEAAAAAAFAADPTGALYPFNGLVTVGTP